MHTRCTSRTAMLAAAVILTIAAAFSAGSATAVAQCNNLTIVNNTHCDVTVYVLCSNGFTLGPYTVPAGGSLVVPIPSTCSTFRLVTIVCGNRTIVPNGCLNNVGIANGCCADVCFNGLTCTLTFTQVPGPCLCP